MSNMRDKSIVKLYLTINAAYRYRFSIEDIEYLNTFISLRQSELARLEISAFDFVE